MPTVRVGIGAIGENGEQKFKPYRGRITAKEFMEFLEEPHLEFGKVAVMCDNWSMQVQRCKEISKGKQRCPTFDVAKGLAVS